MTERFFQIFLILAGLVILEFNIGFHDALAEQKTAERAELAPSNRDADLQESVDLTRQGEGYCEKGDYIEGLRVVQRARELRERWLAPNDLRVAETLFWVAHIYYELDQLESAEPLLGRVLNIQEAAPNGKPEDIVRTLNRLSTLYHQRGQHKLALEYNDRGLKIISNNNLTQHFLHAILLYNREIYLRDYPESKATYKELVELNKRARAIALPIFGKYHRFIAGGYLNAGKSAHQNGDYQLANDHLRYALELWQHIPPYPRVIMLTLNELAAVLCDMGKFEEAERFYNHALSYEKILGSMHPKLHVVRVSLALMYLRLGKTLAARDLLLHSLDLLEQRTRSQGIILSDRQFVHFAEQTQLLEEMTYSALQTRLNDPEVPSLLMVHTLLRKGRTIDEAAELSRDINRELSQVAPEQLGKLRNLRGQYAALALAGPGPGADFEQYRRRLDEFGHQAEAIESDLARLSATLRSRRAIPESKSIVSAVARRLPADGALIEFVEFRNYHFDLPEKQQPDDRQYLMLALRADGHIQATSLGSAAQMDELVAQLHSYLRTPKSSAQDYHATGLTLYQRIMQPLVPFLTKTRWLFFAADGGFYKLSMEAVYDGRRYLTDRYQFVNVTSGRDLLRQESPARVGTSVEIFADPSYAAEPRYVAKNTAALGTSRGNRELRPDSLATLPGTREEALSIQRLIPKAHLHLGLAASESELLGTQRPGILHIATHGLFADDRSTSTTVQARHSQFEEDTSDLADHPLLRSALAMAGAAASGVPASGERPDGIVTALELSNMDLWGTQLVVLSACNSGRGYTRAGQGIYGLRRAVLVAGAETLVTALWRVDDEVTKDLMIEYYARILRGTDRAKALRQASHRIRRQFQHPYYWASFIIIGRSGALHNIGVAQAQRLRLPDVRRKAPAR